ncbi:phospholipid-binding protein MlaC [Caulobacter sp. Root1472]|jgi:phospholipid transport system substrate-binding protein|uniref:MlaC/ttg2D family ABC transporter substrate-binding protein n=1 Tax=Caulobacter sp. Root1472 TaxID=1736470 RepID=UPI0006FC876C|nr:ABC transporter substrate-binding protein [Caulobacter sp. Root1472]KQZ31214.1 toluene tolerance protein [Caulobacter sp. Root1472]
MTSPETTMIDARPTRRFAQLALVALIGLGALSQARPALAQAARDPQAEQFVQSRAQRVITVLADKNQSIAQKKATFHQAIDQLADVPKITNFVLGKYARTVTPDQRQRFAAAFRVYAESVYQNRISDYHGEVLKVTGSTVRKPGDVIVNTTISGGQIGQPLPVAWRVLGGGTSWKVVDIQFKGVWLAITQQQDFVSTIDNAGGNIDVLISQLQRDAQRPASR